MWSTGCQRLKPPSASGRAMSVHFSGFRHVYVAAEVTVVASSGILPVQKKQRMAAQSLPLMSGGTGHTAAVYHRSDVAIVRSTITRPRYPSRICVHRCSRCNTLASSCVQPWSLPGPMRVPTHLMPSAAVFQTSAASSPVANAGGGSVFDTSHMPSLLDRFSAMPIRRDQSSTMSTACARFADATSGVAPVTISC